MIRVPPPRGLLIRHATLHMLAILAAILLAAGLLSTSGLAQWGPHSLEWVEPTPLDPDVAERLFTTYDTGRYADFDRLADSFAESVINPFEFEADAERWMAVAADRPRRAFVAAAVALELANLSIRQEPIQARVIPDRDLWQRRQTAIQVGFVLAELGCAWLRDHPTSPAEHAWHAAFVALARGSGRQGLVIPIVDPGPRLARLAHSIRAEGMRQTQQAQRAHEDDERQNANEMLMARFRSQATRTSHSTRIDVSSLLRSEHGRHLVARFPEDPVLVFLEAAVREARTRYTETLLDGWFSPVWLDPAAVDRIAKGGARQIGAVPPTRRMDRPSADRLLRVVPEPLHIVYTTSQRGDRPSAAFTSLMLWEVVDLFHAVPAREPVAAETAVRLGQNYGRLARPDLALPELARAESLATTPYELYLARLFAGAVFARAGRPTEAILAFRGALQAVPRAQSASFALAPLLLEVDAREDAAEILEAAMTVPLAEDPLDYYYEGDPTAASRLLTRLREEATR